MILRACIDSFLLLFFVFVCAGKALPAALAFSSALFVMRARRRAAKRCGETATRNLRIDSGRAGAAYSCRFRERDILSEGGAPRRASATAYEELVEIAMRPEFFLLVSRKGELVFVFRAQLADEKEWIRFLFGRTSRIRIWRKWRFRALYAAAGFLRG